MNVNPTRSERIVASSHCSSSYAPLPDVSSASSVLLVPPLQAKMPPEEDSDGEEKKPSDGDADDRSSSEASSLGDSNRSVGARCTGES